MLFSRMVGGLGNQLFQTAAFLKYRRENERVIISFLGDIHIPRRENCLNYIFEMPKWIYLDGSSKLNLSTKLLACISARLRFGSFLPLISINDRNFYLSKAKFKKNKIINKLDLVSREEFEVLKKLVQKQEAAIKLLKKKKSKR